SEASFFEGVSGARSSKSIFSASSRAWKALSSIDSVGLFVAMRIRLVTMSGIGLHARCRCSGAFEPVRLAAGLAAYPHGMQRPDHRSFQIRSIDRKGEAVYLRPRLIHRDYPVVS